MISNFRRREVSRKPLPAHSTPRTYSPDPLPATFTQIDEDHYPSQLHSIPSTISRAPSPRSHTAINSPEMSLQEYQRQHGRRQDLEEEFSTDAMAQELEGNTPYPSTAPALPPPASQQWTQPPAPIIIIPPPDLPSYFIMDTDTGMAYYSTAQSLPIARPLSPPSISASYDILGVPVITSYNPADRAKDVILWRYAQECHGMTVIEEEMIKRLMELDLEREEEKI
ncbi:hypothetical protein N431DRAFT_440764 [Stipitochalara longipes BDJ]|nr:hypothetical protein N431DRAFT_440764 [Stipitochalara longipes BDJ]